MEAALEGGLDRAYSDCPRLESDVSGSWTSGKRVSVLGDSWYAGSMDILLEPGENLFRSLRWDLNDLDPHDVTCSNWGVYAFRGKRYETAKKEEEVEVHSDRTA